MGPEEGGRTTAGVDEREFRTAAEQDGSDPVMAKTV